MTENTPNSRPERMGLLCAALLADYDGRGPDFRKVQMDAASARIPTLVVNGLRYFERHNLPTIAAYYGMTPKVSANTRPLVAA